VSGVLFEEQKVGTTSCQTLNMALLSIAKFSVVMIEGRERFLIKGKNIVVANQNNKRIDIYFNIIKHAFLLNMLSLCISTCINYSMTSCKQAYQAQ